MEKKNTILTGPIELSDEEYKEAESSILKEENKQSHESDDNELG